MTDAISIKDVQAEQDKLQKAFTKNKVAYYEAQKKLDASKAKLTKFNARYGRVLQMMNEE